MMIKIFLISACVSASAYAGWEWNPNDNDPSGSRIRRMQADPYSHFANNADFPNIPEMPNFDNYFPFKLKFPDIKIPKLEIPEMKFPGIKISPEDIASQKGRDYHGVSMVTINGETVITINNGGNVKTCKVPAGSSKEETAAILAGQCQTTEQLTF